MNLGLLRREGEEDPSRFNLKKGWVGLVALESIKVSLSKLSGALVSGAGKFLKRLRSGEVRIFRLGA